MLRIVKLRILCVVLAIASATVLPLGAQQSKPPAPAPVPTQILTAKKVFVSNARGDDAEITGLPDRTYNQFYAAIKSLGRFEFVSSPSEADLVFEIRFTNPIGSVVVTSGAFVSGNSINDPQLNLSILDPKTHTSLWWFTEHIQVGRKRPQSDLNFDQAMAKLTEDIRTLSTQHPGGADPSSVELK